MRIKFSLGPEVGSLYILKEPGDKRAKASGFTKDVHGWGPEIHLLHLLRLELNKMGFNLVRVRLAEDGHMYGDNYMNYLRTPKSDLRKQNVPYPYLFIVDGNYAIRSSAEAYNKGEEVHFTVHGNVFDDFPQSDWFLKAKALCDHHGIECQLWGEAVDDQ